MRAAPIPSVFAVLLACACGGAQQQVPAPPAPPALAPAGCDARSERVHALYLAALSAEPPDLRDELATANTEMVIDDCRRDPARRVPCLDAARDIETLERECLAPLDDAGETEQRRFGS